MPNIKRLFLFALVLTLFCGGYVLLAPGQTAVPHESWRHELGEVLGSVAVWLLVILYGRTLLKIFLRQPALLERLLPHNVRARVAALGQRLMPGLNTTHPAAGAIAVLLIGGHAFLEGVQQANLLLLGTLLLLVWQLTFGLFLLSRHHAISGGRIKKFSYLAHAQLYTGIAIGICALFGHLLLQD